MGKEIEDDDRRKHLQNFEDSIKALLKAQYNGKSCFDVR